MDTGVRVECPYCSMEVDIVRLADHVRVMDDDDHGRGGSTPVEGVDNPWNLRVAVPDEPPSDAEGTDDPDDVPTVTYDPAEIRRGRCPACDRGALALAGGDGFLARGRRRLVCPNCGWESPEWVRIRE